MSFPFSYPAKGQSWIMWRLQLLLQPLRAPLDANAGKLGMSATPQLLKLPLATQLSAESDTASRVMLMVAGQKHCVPLARTKTKSASWFPIDASAYWLANAHCLGWLVGQGDSGTTSAGTWSLRARAYASWEALAANRVTQSKAPYLHAGDVVGQRLVALLQFAEEAQRQDDIETYKAVQRRLKIDAAFLDRASNRAQSGWSRLSALEGMCAFGGSFDGLEGWLRRQLPLVLAQAHIQWDEVGCHESADSAVSLSAFVSLTNALAGLNRIADKTQGEYAQLEQIQDVIQRAGRLIADLLLPGEATVNASGRAEIGTRVAAFSGFPLISGDQARQMLEKARVEQNVIRPANTQLPWVKSVSHGLVKPPVAAADEATGPETSKAAKPSSLTVCVFNSIARQWQDRYVPAYHGGMGALEIASEAGVLVGACGMGQDVSRWGASLRMTQAFSTLCLGDRDAIALRPYKSHGANRHAPTFASLSKRRVSDASVIELSHDGFSSPQFDVVAYRRIRMTGNADRIDGEDRLDVTPRGSHSDARPPTKADAQHGAVKQFETPAPSSAMVRFQFAPGISVRKDTKTRLIIEQPALPGGAIGSADTTANARPIQWEFVLTNGELELDNGLWFDQHSKPRPAPNLAINAPVRDGRCLIFWRFERL